jgi:transposase InsO family protein
VAIIDWATRRVLSWRLSNTLSGEFCVEALGEALARFGKPEIFNSDQGSQFASEDFTRVLPDHRIEISMDGRGRCHDNIFVERLWWTVKYEWVYLRPAAEGLEQRRSLVEFFDCTTCGVRISRSAGRHRTRPVSARLARPWQRQRNEIVDQRREFVDSRLLRCPPDRASAVPYGFTAAPQHQELNLLPGKVKPSAGDQP